MSDKLAHFLSKNEYRREAIEQVLASISQDTYRERYIDGLTTTTSYKRAIRAFCMMCMGFDNVAEEIKNCTGYSCPLYQFRPNKKDDEKTKLTGEEKRAFLERMKGANDE